MTDTAPNKPHPQRPGDLHRIPVPLQAILILVVAVIPAMLVGGEIAPATQPSDDSNIDRLSVAEALDLPHVIWVDARPRNDYARSHIPGALPLNEDTWETDLVDLLMKWNPGDTVVVYCGSASCDASAEVARRLIEDAGLAPVAVLMGGWDAYEASMP